MGKYLQSYFFVGAGIVIIVLLMVFGGISQAVPTSTPTQTSVWQIPDPDCGPGPHFILPEDIVVPMEAEKYVGHMYNTGSEISVAVVESPDTAQEIRIAIPSEGESETRTIPLQGSEGGLTVTIKTCHGDVYVSVSGY